MYNLLLRDKAYRKCLVIVDLNEDTEEFLTDLQWLFRHCCPVGMERNAKDAKIRVKILHTSFASVPEGAEIPSVSMEQLRDRLRIEED